MGAPETDVACTQKTVFWQNLETIKFIQKMISTIFRPANISFQKCLMILEYNTKNA